MPTFTPDQAPVGTEAHDAPYGSSPMTTSPAHTARPARLEPPPTAHVGGAGEAVEIDAGGDLDPSPPPPLSVAQLQHALRLARRQSPPTGAGVDGPARGNLACAIPCHIAAFSAHPAAGASTLALAVADTLAATGRPAALLDYAAPGRSGLSAATDTELGTVSTGDWQVGRRATVTVYRRVIRPDDALDADGALPPAPPPIADHTHVVADLSGLDPARRPQPDARSTVLLVCRPTIPGLAYAEAWLTTFAAGPATVLLAAVGPRRWPKLAAASLGPQLERLRADGQVITVPMQPRLALTGVTADPLPTALLTAAGRIVQRMPAAARSSTGPDITTHPEPHDDADNHATEVVEDHTLDLGDGFALLPTGVLEPAR